MKKTFLFLTMLIVLFAINACHNEEDNSLLSNSTENTRKVFVNVDEYKAYLNEFDNANRTELRTNFVSPEATNQTIVEKFLYLSSLGQIFNKNHEFQIDNQVIKLGESGYTTYIIDVPYYESSLRFIKNESSLLNNLSRYKKIEDELYQIDEGLILHYSGEPLIEEQDITDYIIDDKVTTRAALNPYELKVSFWSTSNFVFNGCGVQISYKEANNKGKLKDYNTNLSMHWQGIVTSHKSKGDSGMGQISYFGNGYKYDTGSSDKKTFGEVGGVFMHRFKYYLIGGAIWGTARHSSGTIIQKGQFD